MTFTRGHNARRAVKGGIFKQKDEGGED